MKISKARREVFRQFKLKCYIKMHKKGLLDRKQDPKLPGLSNISSEFARAAMFSPQKKV